MARDAAVPAVRRRVPRRARSTWWSTARSRPIATHFTLQQLLGDLQPVAVSARAEEQRDPVALDLARAGALRALARRGGGRRQAERPAAPDRLQRLRRARLLRRRCRWRSSGSPPSATLGVITVFLHSALRLSTSANTSTSLRSPVVGICLLLLPDPADGDLHHAGARGPAAGVGGGRPQPRRHPPGSTCGSSRSRCWRRRSSAPS